jgi:hypothetical protein
MKALIFIIYFWNFTGKKGGRGEGYTHTRQLPLIPLSPPEFLFEFMTKPVILTLQNHLYFHLENATF